MSETRILGRDVYMTRAFDAPRETVFRFFTDPDLLARWFGPIGFTVPIDSVIVDARLDGRWALAMEDPDSGERFPIEATITEIVEPELLVLSMHAETGMGEIDHIVLRIEFHDHGDKTRITLHQGPFPAPDMPEASAAGWESSFTKIDTMLAAS